MTTSTVATSLCPAGHTCLAALQEATLRENPCPTQVVPLGSETTPRNCPGTTIPSFHSWCGCTSTRKCPLASQQVRGPGLPSFEAPTRDPLLFMLFRLKLPRTASCKRVPRRRLRQTTISASITAAPWAARYHHKVPVVAQKGSRIAGCPPLPSPTDVGKALSVCHGAMN